MAGKSKVKWEITATSDYTPFGLEFVSDESWEVWDAKKGRRLRIDRERNKKKERV